jgi:hypothetical protein
VLADRGLQHKERKVSAEKGLVEDLSAKLDAALSKISDDPGDGGGDQECRRGCAGLQRG